MMKKVFIISFLVLSFGCQLFAQRDLEWADSVMNTLSLKQRIAQTMVLRVPLNMNEKQQKEFERLISSHQVGGVCFFVGTAEKQLQQTKSFQQKVDIPLLVCIDGENGLGMRLKDCYAFPNQMLMGAIPAEHDSLIYQMGVEIGKQCRKMGIHINFAPVVDLNSNPANPVIGSRSFGEDKEAVARKGIMYMKGLQSQRVVAVAKHFPGHGDTDVDSHYDLPVINHTRDQVMNVDVYPFRKLIEAGVRGVMVAHLQVNAYDDRPNMPATLSPAIVTDMLRNQLGFEELIITDGIDMKGVTKYYKDGQAELKSLQAGNDIVILPPDVHKSINTIARAAAHDDELKDIIDQHCRKVLQYKYKLGLNNLDLSKLQVPDEEDKKRCDEIAYQMALKGITLLNGEGWEPGKDIAVHYKSPYFLADSTTPVVLAYQDSPVVRRAVQDLLEGKAHFVGKLPVTASGYAIWSGTSTVPNKQSSNDHYSRLEPAGMDASRFLVIDSIIEAGIQQQAYPGCVLLVAKDGKVVYNRAYGHMTYDSVAVPVDTNMMFDVASVTKVAATTLAVMKLVDAGKVQLDDKLSMYLPYLKNSNKKNITIRQALSHHARLKSFDSYWKTASTADNPREDVLRQITESKLNKKDAYVYSDLGFILLAEMVQVVSGQSLDLFMSTHFYKPLGMNRTAFNPLQQGFAVDSIMPTEVDKVYRNQCIQGTVHDPNAFCMGGVAGHAGLFSTSSDLAVLFTMMLNGGSYNGVQLLSPQVIEKFNKQYFTKKGNRRALGFDKPRNPAWGHTAPEVSQSSYGHTGFTGTMVWVDPKVNLVYIFLSNRVHPTATPNLLSRLNVRTDVQSQIYKSLNK